MIKSTYILAQGVGFTTERKLWSAGAVDWDRFIEKGDSLPINRRTRDTLIEAIQRAQTALDSGDVAYFANMLPQSEHWRAIESFGKVCYLDIETDGGNGPGCITVIGASDGDTFHAYLKGADLDDFAEDAKGFDSFVTFFGGGFDLPVLKRSYPALESVFASRLHVDLCPALRRLGYRGGLKKIEKQLGISRTDDTDGLDGLDAVRFWNTYRRGGAGADEALRLLVEYNREDVMNMVTLLNFALPKLRADVGFDG